MKITMKRNKKDYSEKQDQCLPDLSGGTGSRNQYCRGTDCTLYETAGLSGQHWNYSDRRGSSLGPWFGMLPNLISGIFGGMTVISIRCILHL